MGALSLNCTFPMCFEAQTFFGCLSDTQLVEMVLCSLRGATSQRDVLLQESRRIYEKPCDFAVAN